jgi:hypothetical protein
MLLLLVGCLGCATSSIPTPATGRPLTSGHGSVPPGGRETPLPNGGTVRASSRATSPALGPEGALPNPPATRTTAIAPDRWILDESRELRIEAAAPSGAWLAYCVGQSELLLAIAPRGDKGALPRRVDQLLAWSNDGTKVVIRENGHAILLDLNRDGELRLDEWGPDLDNDALAEHRSFAFSWDSQTLAFLSKSPSPRLHWLTFSGAATEPLHKSLSLPYLPWRVRLQSSLAELDGGEPGARWPVPRASAPELRCQKPAAGFAAYPELSDPLARYRRAVLLVDLDHPTEPAPAPGFVMSFGKRWVRRSPEGRLLLVDGKVQKQIASERCGGRIRHADLKTSLFIVTCEHFIPEPAPSSDPKKTQSKTKPEFRFATYLLAPSYVQELPVMLPRIGFDVGPNADEPDARFVPVSDGTINYVVDLKARSVSQLDAAARFLTSAGDHAILLKDGRVVDFDGAPRTHAQQKTPLPGRKIDALSPVLIRGSFVHAEGTLYHPLYFPKPSPGQVVSLTPLGATVKAEGPVGSKLTGPLLIDTVEPKAEPGSPGRAGLNSSEPRAR